MDENDVKNALNLFQKLDYQRGKAAAGVVVNAVVKEFVARKLTIARDQRDIEVVDAIDRALTSLFGDF